MKRGLHRLRAGAKGFASFSRAGIHRLPLSTSDAMGSGKSRIEKETSMKKDLRGRLMVGLAGWTVVLAGALAVPATAVAGAASSVHTPIVDYLEWELELKGGFQPLDDEAGGEHAYKVAFAYGIAPRWKTELELEYTRAPGEAARVEEYEFENVFQLTEHGEHWLDAGIFAELSHNRLDNETALEIGPMLQKEIGQNQLNLNLLLERRLDAADNPGEAIRTEVGYQAQWKWFAHPAFQPGVQVFGKLGSFGSLHSEELMAGPAFFGVVRLGNAKNLKYDAGLLTGLTHGTPDTTFRFRIEYEFF
jgi:hypothetical protein